MRVSSPILCLSIGAAILLSGASLSHADTVVGIFSSPQVTGNLLDVSGSPGFFDNTDTAFSSITNSTAVAPVGSNQQSVGSKLQWGTNPGFSTLIFFGKTIPSDPFQPFDLGTLTYANGTSALDSLIFGATLTLYATGDGSIGSNHPNGTSSVGIVTTSNLAVAGSEKHDADFITVSGAANQSFNVYENQAATAELYGQFVSGSQSVSFGGTPGISTRFAAVTSPHIVITNIVLNPGQSNVAFIGNGNPVAVPETSSMIVGLGVIGLIGLECFGRKRRPQPAV